VASELALREPLGALILQNTFTSIPDLGAELFPYLPVRWLHRIKYDTVNRLPRIRVPVLVAHSREDDLIGFHHGERNFAAANQPKHLLELRGRHNGTIEEDRERYLAGLDQFLAQHFPFTSTARKQRE
jgi:pimeloyl-ACP methyl ester carboxylesterase